MTRMGTTCNEVVNLVGFTNPTAFDSRRVMKDITGVALEGHFIFYLVHTSLNISRSEKAN